MHLRILSSLGNLIGGQTDEVEGDGSRSTEILYVGTFASHIGKTNVHGKCGHAQKQALCLLLSVFVLFFVVLLSSVVVSCCRLMSAVVCCCLLLSVVVGCCLLLFLVVSCCGLLLVVSCCLLLFVVGGWLFDLGCRLFDVGLLLVVVVGCWLLVV